MKRRILPKDEDFCKKCGTLLTSSRSCPKCYYNDEDEGIRKIKEEMKK